MCCPYRKLGFISNFDHDNHIMRNHIISCKFSQVVVYFRELTYIKSQPCMNIKFLLVD